MLDDRRQIRFNICFGKKYNIHLVRTTKRMLCFLQNDNRFKHDFRFSNIPDNLSESLKISLYRIIQESLTNSLKYSKATKIIVKVIRTDHDDMKNIELEIYDDGVGIDDANIKPGLGLLGMKERVEMHNGVFEFSSSQGNGFRISIVIPVDN